jgi:hypothetical protein
MRRVSMATRDELMPSANLAMFNIVLGSLGTAWVGVMAYYFGGTHAGRAKDWMLYQSQPAQSPKY